MLKLDQRVDKIWMLVPDGQGDKSRMLLMFVVVYKAWVLTLDMTVDKAWMLVLDVEGFNEALCLYQTGGQTRLGLFQWE